MKHSKQGAHRRKRFGRQAGATAAEYALVASLIAVTILATVTLIGQLVSDLFAVPGW